MTRYGYREQYRKQCARTKSIDQSRCQKEKEKNIKRQIKSTCVQQDLQADNGALHLHEFECVAKKCLMTGGKRTRIYKQAMLAHVKEETV